MRKTDTQTKKKVTRRELLKRGFYIGLSTSLFVNGCSKISAAKKPNIILITLDTTRVDHLGCYGYHRNTSPNLDELAQKSVIYTNAIAPSSWTLPSHASLFTGKFTTSHGVQYDPNGPLKLTSAIEGPKAWEVYRARGLAQDETTLAQILKQTGYNTGAVVGGPWMKKVFGFQKGFDFYDDQQIGSVNGRVATQVTNAAISWLQKINSKNFFLFLNYFDPHGPYTPPAAYAGKFLPTGMSIDDNSRSLEKRLALYDAEILYMDHCIGQLIRFLKEKKVYDNTWFIITADHGELFGEHGKFGHGLYLFQEEIHVPLFMKYPGSEVLPAKTNSPVQLTDLLPLICKRLGLSPPTNIQGGSPPQINHPLLAEAYPLQVLTKDGHWRAYFENDFKYLWNSRGKHLLYNLKNDPREQKNLIAQKPAIAADMSQKLIDYVTSLPLPGPSTPAQQLDEETKKALKSLGYVK